MFDRFMVVTPSVLQVGQTHTVIVSLYEANGRKASARVDVELENGATIFTGQEVEVSGRKGKSSAFEQLHVNAIMASETNLPLWLENSLRTSFVNHQLHT